MGGGLKWLGTESGNRIHAPSPTTHMWPITGRHASSADGQIILGNPLTTPPPKTLSFHFLQTYSQSETNEWNLISRTGNVGRNIPCSAMYNSSECSGWITLFNVLQVLHNMLWRTFNWYMRRRSLSLLKGVRFYTELIDAIMFWEQHAGCSIIPQNVNTRKGSGAEKDMTLQYKMCLRWIKMAK